MDPRIRSITGKGIYVLHLELASDVQIVVGGLGAQRFGAGHYAYVGRAFGPGGLAARLAHHLRRAASPHWHLDYLRAHGRVQEVWYGHTPAFCEHQWAQALMNMRGAAKFGRRPRKTTFRRRLLRHSAGVVSTVHCIRAVHPA
jgi:Uri superfamily endonuclease